MDLARPAGCCSAPPRTWQHALTNGKLPPSGLTPPTTNDNPGLPPRAGFPLPYIKQPLPDPVLPITCEDDDEDRRNPDTDQSNEPGTSPYKPFVESGRSDEYYKRYLKLAQNVAYKYPNPGPPVERHGRAGASWRHIKEVQSHDNRVLYVDGTVRLYDSDYISSFASRNLPLGLARQTPLSHIPRELHREQPGAIWKPANRGRPINATTSFLPGNPVKYKGFYNYN